MKKKLAKWQIIAIIIFVIPFILMFCFHIGIAFGQYFGININVPNVDASSWFMFSSSYLGGSMTLIGVILTLRHGQSSQQYEKKLENIEKERERLGRIIFELNTFAPSTIYQQFGTLCNVYGEYNSADIASIRYQIVEEQRKINSSKLELITLTDIYAMTCQCSTCKKSCRIKTILPEFQQIYDKICSNLYNVLIKLDSYVLISQNNARYNSLIRNCKEANTRCQNAGQPLPFSESVIKEYEDKIIDANSIQNEILAAINEINNYNQREIQQLISLFREYIYNLKNNAYNDCFQNEVI